MNDSETNSQDCLPDRFTSLCVCCLLFHVLPLCAVFTVDAGIEPFTKIKRVDHITSTSRNVFIITMKYSNNNNTNTNNNNIPLSFHLLFILLFV